MRQTRDPENDLQVHLDSLHQQIVAQMSSDAVTCHNPLLARMSCFGLRAAHGRVYHVLEVEAGLFLGDGALGITDVASCKRLPVDVKNVGGHKVRRPCWLVGVTGREANEHLQCTAIT